MIFQSSGSQGVATKKYAPIALFVYNRPWHTQETVAALLRNPEAEKSHLYIFADAAKVGSEETGVNEVRSYIRQIEGFASVTIVERDSNLGLANSIIDGVSRICREHGRVIVMEDDLVTSSFFLRYMNEGLEKYESEDRVISLHGYVYPVPEPLPETFFIQGADCWGWSTWARAWALFEADGRTLLDELKSKNLCYAFDYDGTYPYSKMLERQILGKNNSWAIRWYASAYLKEKLTLYPARSLVKNIGVDGSGTHCSDTPVYASELSTSPIQLADIVFEDSEIARKQFKQFFIKSRRSLFKRVVGKILRYFN